MTEKPPGSGRSGGRRLGGGGVSSEGVINESGDATQEEVIDERIRIR